MKAFNIFCLLLICYQNSFCQDSATNKFYFDYKLRADILIEWKLDSNGCKKLRGKYARKLEENKYLIGMPKIVFIKNFGNPDYISDMVNYVYVANANCDNKLKIMEDFPRMELVFLFRDDKLNHISILIVH